MKPTAKLHESGQSLWLDNISRDMLDSGQLRRYIDEYSVTGLTSNPSIFERAIASGSYDDEIRRRAAGETPEELFFELRRLEGSAVERHERSAIAGSRMQPRRDLQRPAPRLRRHQHWRPSASQRLEHRARTAGGIRRAKQRERHGGDRIAPRGVLRREHR